MDSQYEILGVTQYFGEFKYVLILKARIQRFIPFLFCRPRERFLSNQTWASILGMDFEICFIVISTSSLYDSDKIIWYVLTEKTCPRKVLSIYCYCNLKYFTYIYTVVFSISSYKHSRHINANNNLKKIYVCIYKKKYSVKIFSTFRGNTYEKYFLYKSKL